jgi:hypothetical protein
MIVELIGLSELLYLGNIIRNHHLILAKCGQTPVQVRLNPSASKYGQVNYNLLMEMMISAYETISMT